MHDQLSKGRFELGIGRGTFFTRPRRRSRPSCPRLRPHRATQCSPGSGRIASSTRRSTRCSAPGAFLNLILIGWRENGSLLYTAVGAILRTYAVVVADDATSATQDYDVAIGRYQLLTQLSNDANNQPLKQGAVTLSKTDLITFQ
jgi:hypothetical protein